MSSYKIENKFRPSLVFIKYAESEFKLLVLEKKFPFFK
ncbi:hypothetical protein SAMN05421876_10150 [Kaistella jeonii]|nr:hypothetical protein SAMN05421876_10150 [Kaistella jeonii]VEI94657.1 Uncharacterised protein [Kaistella jeonii]